MDTLLIIRQNYSNFTTVEKKIADYIFEVGEKMLEKSAQEVASEIGSSSAALVRFSRKLGYDGFSQLKQKLSASYAVHEDDEDYYKEVNDSETPSSIKNKLKVRVNHMVETTNAALSDDEIMAAVALIDEAESIFVFGIGASSMVAQDIFQKFSRIGKQVFFIQDAHLFVSSLSISDRKTIFIGISMKGETKEVIELARVKRDGNSNYCDHFKRRIDTRTDVRLYPSFSFWRRLSNAYGCHHEFDGTTLCCGHSFLYVCIRAFYREL